MIRKYKLLAILILAFALKNLTAQELITTAYGEIKTDEGSVCFTVGQLFCSYQSTAECSLTEGVQQPYEISIHAGLDKHLQNAIECRVFPNPVDNILVLRIDASISKDLIYSLYSSEGKLVETKAITSEATYIKMDDLLPATYLLQISKRQEILATYKIIKNR
ncbi:MAG: T9SS type A sorting domain-containing protein [Carboxylicivirga sp.]|jgi:hypothetical protein|nr:T9SS type A sorting domain-containing protein [Carboxylicivirga sp.]